MDPYHWVYSAPDTVWPDAGNDRTVTFDVYIYDERGMPASVADVSFEVYDAAVLLASGAVTETVVPGTYQGSFDLTETHLGAAAFSGQDPKELSLQISTAADGLIKEHPVTVGRWGCDRCHVGYDTAVALYYWCAPAGGSAPASPHIWGKILGGSKDHGGFTIDFLTDAENTHTPANSLNVHPFHEKTKVKQAGNPQCSPCHQGSGQLRIIFGSGTMAKSEAVECTFCHGIEGGYVPASGLWAANGGYISAGHRHENVPVQLPTVPPNPYLARQTCSNSGCHGHIKDDKEGEVLHNKPDCRDCHGIHNDNF
jgi:hypothetical protein